MPILCVEICILFGNLCHKICNGNFSFWLLYNWGYVINIEFKIVNILKGYFAERAYVKSWLMRSKSCPVLKQKLSILLLISSNVRWNNVLFNVNKIHSLKYSMKARLKTTHEWTLTQFWAFWPRTPSIGKFLKFIISRYVWYVSIYSELEGRTSIFYAHREVVSYQ